jgi:hypothetical protein
LETFDLDGHNLGTVLKIISIIEDKQLVKKIPPQKATVDNQSRLHYQVRY